MISIGNSAFKGCSCLKSITIPNSVTSIGNYAFSGCTAITSMKVEVGNMYYDSRNDCNAIIRKSDNTLVFGCKNTIIPNNVTCIGMGTFYGCTSLTSITIPNSVKVIDDFAFYQCTGLTSITIPNSITSIGDRAFYCCTGLTSVAIPNSVTYIDYWAFEECTCLKKASIDVNKDLSINSRVFESCGLEELIMSGETLPNYTDDDFADGLYNTCTIYVPSSLYNEYCSTSPWNQFANIVMIPDGTIALSDGITYTNLEQYDGQEILYTRTFNNTFWQALYIPFSMSYEDWKDDFEVAYINSIHQYDKNDDGAIDETTMEVVKIKNGSLIPNMPYLIKAKTTGEKTITVTDATLYKAEENSIECSTMLAKYTFTGTYNTIPASTLIANNYYAMGGGSLVITDGTSDLKPFRWYMKIDARSPMYNVNLNAKPITISVVGEEEATGINELRMTNDELPVYDLNGRRVDENNLKPGLYIKNGKKVIIK